MYFSTTCTVVVGVYYELSLPQKNLVSRRKTFACTGRWRSRQAGITAHFVDHSLVSWLSSHTSIVSRTSNLIRTIKGWSSHINVSTFIHQSLQLSVGGSIVSLPLCIRRRHHVTWRHVPSSRQTTTCQHALWLNPQTMAALTSPNHVRPTSSSRCGVSMCFVAPLSDATRPMRRWPTVKSTQDVAGTACPTDRDKAREMKRLNSWSWALMSRVFWTPAWTRQDCWQTIVRQTRVDFHL